MNVGSCALYSTLAIVRVSLGLAKFGIALQPTALIVIAVETTPVAPEDPEMVKKPALHSPLGEHADAGMAPSVE
jgi:hypothetical protein|tara:strand:- start:298 stop:519 length:222 start_codon:yes stop_codon:yes gene_type:complete